MAPPEPSRTQDAGPADGAPAAPFRARVEGMKTRAEFLRAARGRKAARGGFILQARARGDDGPARIGFTCSRKVGNAVARNRAKRRLREAARKVLDQAGREGWDYVLIGRRERTAQIPFDRLLQDLGSALDEIHGSRP